MSLLDYESGGLFAELLDGEDDDEDYADITRQARIAAGEEHACLVCGCSESRACPGGCVWATPTLCSRCALTSEAIHAR